MPALKPNQIGFSSTKIKSAQEFEHLSTKRQEWREEKNDDGGCNGNRQTERDAPPNLGGNGLAVERDRKECLSAEGSVDKCRECDCDGTCDQNTANTDRRFCGGLVHHLLTRVFFLPTSGYSPLSP